MEKDRITKAYEFYRAYKHGSGGTPVAELMVEFSNAENKALLDAYEKMEKDLDEMTEVAKEGYALLEIAAKFIMDNHAILEEQGLEVEKTWSKLDSWLNSYDETLNQSLQKP